MRVEITVAGAESEPVERAAAEFLRSFVGEPTRTVPDHSDAKRDLHSVLAAAFVGLPLVFLIVEGERVLEEIARHKLKARLDKLKAAGEATGCEVSIRVDDGLPVDLRRDPIDDAVDRLL